VISSHILPELEELCTSLAIIDHGRVLASGRIADIEQRLRTGAVLRIVILGGSDAAEKARTWFAEHAMTAAAERRGDDLVDVAFRGDDETAAALLREAIAAGHRVASFSRAVSDLEEIFLQVTALETDRRGEGAPA
jgi:ABC-2 type transport system ATP-binding protein